MSYDYNALLEEISLQRRLAASTDEVDDERLTHRQAALDAFTQLSTHCPMTPRLWMQYANDAAQLLLETSVSGNDMNVEGIDDNDQIAASHTTRLDILELGLHEFPACAMLQFHYLELLAAAAAASYSSSNNNNKMSKATDEGYDDNKVTHDRFVRALQQALEHIGLGSHRNEDACWVVNTYRLGCYYLAQHPHDDLTWQQLFLRRSKTPMQHANEGLIAEFREFLRENAILQQQQEQQRFTRQTQLKLEAELERHRRSTSHGLDAVVVHYEDEVDVELQAEGLLTRPQTITITTCPTAHTPFDNENAELWKQLLDPATSSSTWMGLGGIVPATAFVKYALAVVHSKFHLLSQPQQPSSNVPLRHKLVVAIYERGLAECPTVEALWLSYLKYLTRTLLRPHQPQPPPQEHKSKSRRQPKAIVVDDAMIAAADAAKAVLESVTLRAVRNCPYSLALVQQRLQVALLLANTNGSVYDPDALLVVVQQALSAGFLTATPALSSSSSSSGLELYLTAIRMTQRRILHLLTPVSIGNYHLRPYDDAAFPETNVTLEQTTTPPWSLLKSAVQEEVQDLCEDLRDMYDAADSYFRNQQVQHEGDGCTVTQARRVLGKLRARCERDVLGPCEHAFRWQDTSNTSTSKEAFSTSSWQAQHAALACQDTWIKSQQPSHPDAYASYIATVQSFSILTTLHPSEVVTRLQWIRALYQKGLMAAAAADTDNNSESSLPVTITSFTPPPLPLGIAMPSSLLLFGRDYEWALREFCEGYLEFEHQFGSDDSYAKACQAVSKKRATWMTLSTATVAGLPFTTTTTVTADATVAAAPQIGDHSTNEGGGKRPRQDDNGDPHHEPSSARASNKKKRLNEEKKATEEPLSAASSEVRDGTVTEKTVDKAPGDSGMETDEVENADLKSITKKLPPPQQHKVRIGNLEYPAHPFTVRVSNLSPESQDMDLVDVFRPKCGAIVHAKIIRDKHPPHPSKGWGLIQFEQIEAADTALALDGILGLHERLVQVQRSHMPAATLVPPGKHRVNPKGLGKSTKRNQKRRELKPGDDPDHEEITMNDHNVTSISAKAPPSADALTAAVAADHHHHHHRAIKAKPVSTAAAAGGVLNFRPRNMVLRHGTDHRKVKLALSPKNKSTNSQEPS